MYAFWTKRELQCIFLRKKAIVITSKDGTTIFFSHYNLFLRKLKQKLTRKVRGNTDASIWDHAHAAAVSVKRSTGLRKRLSKTLNGYQCLTLINVHAPTWLVLFLCVFISFNREQISANKYSNTYWNLHHGSSVLHWWQNERTLTHHHSTWAPWILLKNTWIIKLMGVEQKRIVTAISTFVHCFTLF